MNRLVHHVLQLAVGTVLAVGVTVSFAAPTCPANTLCTTGVVHAAGHGGDFECIKPPPTDAAINEAAAEIKFDDHGFLVRTKENTRALGKLAVLVRAVIENCKFVQVPLVVGCTGPNDAVAARRTAELRNWAKATFQFGVVVKELPQCSISHRSRSQTSKATDRGKAKR